MTAHYDTGFAKTIVVVYPGDNSDELQVETFTVFTDGSRRSPYHARTIMMFPENGSNLPATQSKSFHRSCTIASLSGALKARARAHSVPSTATGLKISSQVSRSRNSSLSSRHSSRLRFRR